MPQIELSKQFRNQIKKIMDETVRERVQRELKNLLKDPNIGKPLRYSLKGFRSESTDLSIWLRGFDKGVCI